MDTVRSAGKRYKEDELVDVIKKHPYFKNPCKYPIRIISIMKYLKKKGFDVNERDLDLRVDQLVSEFPNVKKIDFGLYRIDR